MKNIVHYLAKATAFLDWLVQIFGLEEEKDDKKEEEPLSPEVVLLCTERHFEEAAREALHNFQILAERLRAEGYTLRKVAAELDYVYSKWARAVFLQRLKSDQAPYDLLLLECSLGRLRALVEDPRFGGLRPTYDRIKSVVDSELK